MEANETSKEKLTNDLKTIQENGIQSDRKHLKQNMYTQFSDPFEFAREYVVNSFDAMAKTCIISGRETEETVTITIRDDGNGMNKQRIQDFFKIFRSRKDEQKGNSIGRFGVGKMSVAAVPGLILFAGTTSTGTECWRFETDTLIEDRPVMLEKIVPIPDNGTRFEITLIKYAPLSQFLTRISDLLYKYVRHLDIDIYFDLAELDQDQNPIRKKLPRGNWNFGSENLGETYTIEINNIPVEILVGIGKPVHELYQNKVFITSRYNLVSNGLDNEFLIPHLMIRVNSSVFELTFGRHCLSNESVLAPLSREIRETILPEYFANLSLLFNEELFLHSPEIASKIEEMACKLILMEPYHKPWNDLPLFKVVGQPRFSFDQLSRQVQKKGALYIEAEGNAGADYSLFDAPVLMLNQPRGAMDTIEKLFGCKVINLNNQDVVLETPSTTELKLTRDELYFESFLEFNVKREILNHIIESTNQNDLLHDFPDKNRLPEVEDFIGICEEARFAEHDFRYLKWKVNYLVERDGKSPCYSRFFLLKEDSIILNLYNSEIRKLVEISCVNPKIAAHWAFALCLSDPKLLPHITPDAREDLLLIDAMGRIESDLYIATNKSDKDFDYIEFIRNRKMN